MFSNTNATHSVEEEEYSQHASAYHKLFTTKETILVFYFYSLFLIFIILSRLICVLLILYNFFCRSKLNVVLI